MIERFKNIRTRDEGLTLIELLVVITILGILAAIVVFSVGGITDKGQSAACQTDTSTIRTAEEAYFAKNNSYAAPVSALVTAGFLSNNSTYHTVALTPATTPPYTISNITPCTDA